MDFPVEIREWTWKWSTWKVIHFVAHCGLNPGLNTEFDGWETQHCRKFWWEDLWNFLKTTSAVEALRKNIELITSPKNFVFGEVLFSSACICVSVYLCVWLAINSKSSWPILMKFGRMMYYDKRQVPFEDEINRVDRTQTLPKRVVKIDIKATYL